MDCSEARLLMGPQLGGRDTPEEREALRHHLHSCPACQAETDALTRTWNALESLPDAEVPARVWDRIQANLPVPGRAPRPSFWPATAGTAALGLMVSILAAWLLPYERAVALCSEGLRGVLATSLPDPAVFFAVGFLYGLLPLGAAALVASCRLPHWAQWEGRPGIASGLVISAYLRAVAHSHDRSNGSRSTARAMMCCAVSALCTRFAMTMSTVTES